MVGGWERLRVEAGGEADDQAERAVMLGVLRLAAGLAAVGALAGLIGSWRSSSRCPIRRYHVLVPLATMSLGLVAAALAGFAGVVAPLADGAIQSSKNGPMPNADMLNWVLLVGGAVAANIALVMIGTVYVSHAALDKVKKDE